MDKIFREVIDGLVMGGSFGGFALLVLLLMVVGYFKYLKPFFEDFYALKGETDKARGMNADNVNILKDLRSKVENLETIVLDGADTISKNISGVNREIYSEVKNLLVTIEREVVVLLERTEKMSGKSDDIHKDLMIEIARLQTRLEYMNPTLPRGLKK